MTTSVKIAVIGIGSPFGADRVGWQIIEQLKNNKSLAKNPLVQLEASDRPGTLLLEYMKGYQTVILIDAVEGGQAGKLYILDKSELLSLNNPQSSHQIGAAETIALGESLNMLPVELILAGIQTGDKPRQTFFTQTTFNGITRQIVELIESYIIHKPVASSG